MIMDLAICVLLLCCVHICVGYTSQLRLKTDRNQNYYHFWKTVSKRLIPQTRALQQLTNEVLKDLCDTTEYNQNISENDDCIDQVQKTATQRHRARSQGEYLNIRNPKKFMKKLVKSTLTTLIEYQQPLTEIFNDYKTNDNLNADICKMMDTINTHFEQLTKKIGVEMKDYFQMKHVPERRQNTGLAETTSSMKGTEGLASLYLAMTELKETEAVLEFIMKTTWEIHIYETIMPQIKRRRRMKANKNVNLNI